MLTHSLGFPRIGSHRELKKAQEGYWKGETSRDKLLETACELRKRHWTLQAEAGIDLVPAGDFSLYDHMLDVVAMVGAVPRRFGWNGEEVDVDTYFRMARGDGNTNAMEMTKWFDTNYHYIVPEFHRDQTYKLSSVRLLDDVREARAEGHNVKAVLPGPMTFLHLGKETETNFDRWEHLDAVVSVYEEMLAKLAKLTSQIQIDEPILALDLPENVRANFPSVYRRLRSAARGAKLMLATYFDSLVGENALLAANLPVDVLHIDAVRGADRVGAVADLLPADAALSLGVVNGRNVWRVDADATLERIAPIVERLGEERVLLGTSCSLLHCPIDLDLETDLDDEIRLWMAFSKQKCRELRMLADAATGKDVSAALEENRRAWQSRRSSYRVSDPDVQSRLGAVDADMLKRESPYEVRKKIQRETLNLPKLPTTTIGSFPQTADIRRTRRLLKKGEIDESEYRTAMRGFIRESVERQTELELDVLVHGEPERNDMVEHFGEQMDGFCFTRNGWVQSYGSRCVKPPVIFGDVSRAYPMTVDWMRYAQSLTDKPMKGMLTGPITILCWSFVRDDQPRSETCRQIALAVRDEVLDLEKAGIRIIQIDEAALREGLPLRRADWDSYLRWAVDAFRLASSGVKDETQIHTHMCYSEFNEIIEWIAEMDADVISIEASRSNMELLHAFHKFEYPNDIGPGVYDIHSPRVPSLEEIADLLRMAIQVVPSDRLWVNPDCGLKTRDWAESLASLKNMVQARQAVLTELEESR
ncbi:MAG: 5-methyltetrahydropteroyltriglutamate--homocysteine S-methyltransferase [Verrucomicrobiota bacterium]